MIDVDKLVTKQIFIGNKETYDAKVSAHIALCADKNVIRAMGVTIVSVLKNTTLPTHIHIFFNGMLPEEEVNRFKIIAETYATCISIYWLDNTFIEKLHCTAAISVTAYYRLLVPDILWKEHIVQCLYLDTDILVSKNIDELLNYNLMQYAAYVIRDATSIPEWWKKYCKSIGMSGFTYFNSGVILMNNEIMVAENIWIQAIKLAATKAFKYMDQDVLNIVLEGKVKFDETPMYNCTMSVQNWEYNKIGGDNIKIIHFTGDKKPWKLFTSHWETEQNPQDKTHSWKFTYYKLWRQYAAESPWSDVPFDVPKNAHEWRWTSDMYRRNGEYGKAISAYWQYLRYKFFE